MFGRMGEEVRTINKLPTIEIINLITAIEDSILLEWKHQCDPNGRTRFLRAGELPPINDRQGALQVIHFLIDVSRDPEWMNSVRKKIENRENDSGK